MYAAGPMIRDTSDVATPGEHLGLLEYVVIITLRRSETQEYCLFKDSVRTCARVFLSVKLALYLHHRGGHVLRVLD